MDHRRRADQRNHRSPRDVGDMGTHRCQSASRDKECSRGATAKWPSAHRVLLTPSATAISGRRHSGEGPLLSGKIKHWIVKASGISRIAPVSAARNSILRPAAAPLSVVIPTKMHAGGDPSESPKTPNLWWFAWVPACAHYCPEKLNIGSSKRPGSVGLLRFRPQGTRYFDRWPRHSRSSSPRRCSTVRKIKCWIVRASGISRIAPV